jgi:hypothetical protein
MKPAIPVFWQSDMEAYLRRGIANNLTVSWQPVSSGNKTSASNLRRRVGQGRQTEARQIFAGQSVGVTVFWHYQQA